MDHAPPAKGDVVVVRSLEASMCAVRGWVADTAPGQMKIYVNSEWWLTPGSAIDCTVIGSGGTASFATSVRSLVRDRRGAIVVSTPVPLELLDRRRHPRRDLRSDLTWSEVVDGQVSDRTMPGHTVDVSVDGIGFQAATSPDTAQAMLAVSFTIEGEPVSCLAWVVRVDDVPVPVFGRHYSVHANVAAISDEHRDLIEAYVDAAAPDERRDPEPADRPRSALSALRDAAGAHNT